MATIGIPCGVALIGTGALVSHGAHRWYVAGVSTAGLALLALLTYGVIWPFARWIVGPVRSRILRSAEEVHRGLEVLSASYHGVRVTANLNQRIIDGALSVLVMPDELGISDPAFGIPKVLDIKYRVDAKEHHVVKKDGETLSLP